MSEPELLLSLTKKDFKITPFKASGKGGQARNKLSSAIRIQHLASGAVAESSESRSQHENKTIAFRRVIKTPKFEAWLKRAIAEAQMTSDQRRETERRIAEAVERMMTPENILVETQDEQGRWIQDAVPSV